MTTTPGYFQYLDARVLNSFAHYLPPFFELKPISEAELTVPGYLWKIDRQIYFSQMRTDVNAKAWFNSRQTVFSLNAFQNPSFTSETWRKIQETPFWDHQREDLKANFVSSLKQEEEMTAEKYEEWSAPFRENLLGQMPENLNSIFWLLVAKTFFRVLCFLRRQDEIEVANAIWQSVRKDNWDASLDLTEIIVEAASTP